ncbi:MAG: KEOPS complex N(6)-L-threonylcarbamoyladenine synthase Kae1 [Nanoarchaeota archaeon]
MICLGIESTAHSFSIGILKDKEILAEAKSMYTTKKGGIIPSEAAKHHKEIKDKLLEEALNKASINFEDINLMAFSAGPGLAPCLLVGLNFAKELAKKYNKPLLPVNHIVGHLEIGRFLTNAKDPVYVFVSGANTQIIALEGGRYRIFGEALSIGLGNALDKFGRAIGIGFPSGPKIEELAKKGKYVELPYNVKGMDVDFSGIITRAEQLHKKETMVEDLCFSLQETCFAMITEITERAMAHTNKKEALLIGGVAANKRFVEMLDIMCKERNAKFYACPMKYSGDNGLQIAVAGFREYKVVKKTPDLNKIDINPNWRVDQVEVKW